MMEYSPVDVEHSPGGEGLGMRDSRLYVWMRRVSVILAHVTGLSLTVTISVLSRPGTTEGSFCCCKSRKRKVRVHWFFQSAGLLSAVVGLGFMVASKSRAEQPHLASWHSVLGVCTLAAAVLQAACGTCILFPKLLKSWQHPSKVRLYHATFGLVVYSLTTVTVVLAMFSDWFQAIVRGASWWALFLLPLLSALVVINQILNAHLPHKKITN